jgi:hypothetical protein
MFNIRSKASGRGYLRDGTLHDSAAQEYLNSAAPSTGLIVERRDTNISESYYSRCAGTTYGYPCAGRKSRLNTEMYAEVTDTQPNTETIYCDVLLHPIDT